MGGIIGGIASAVIGARSAKKAGQQAMTGYNYLKSNPLITQAQDRGGLAMGRIGALLGLGGDTAAAQDAFNQYQNSTGYQFRMGQGISAIEQSAATRGLLGSGATAKGLTEYGQGMASAEFQNYLTALSGAEGTGLQAAYNVASQGQSGGQAAAQYTRDGAADITAGLGSALGGIGNYMSRPPADVNRPLWMY